MCGIVGFNWQDEILLKKANEIISHRGPDDEGYFVDTKVSMAQKRLSILDISDAGHQPMFYHQSHGASSEKHNKTNVEFAKYCIVFNGEIYNFHEIREQLRKKNYAFNTECDTELIVAAYIEWGVDCVNKFNGMWAFCIYDMAENILFLSRDRLGIKPLYFYAKNNQLIFGSELKTILASRVPKNIDDEAIRLFHVLKFIPHNKSAIKDITKFRQGNNMTYSLTNNKIISYESYWKLPVNKTNTKPNVQLYDLIDNAVKLRMLADVPVGAFLSGGVDSSIIVHHMSKYTQNLKTFSIKFDYAEYNESKWAKIIADKYKTDHHEIEFSAKDVEKLADTLPSYFDEPFGDYSMIPTYLVSQVASKYVTVCLSGTGSDELFGGYSRYSEFAKINKLRKLGSAGKLLAYFYQFYDKNKSRKLRELLNESDEFTRYIKILSPNFRGEKHDYHLDLLKPLERYFNSDTKLGKLLHFDQAVYLPDDLLVKEDRAGMAHQIEGRIPLIDYRLVLQ